MTKQLSQMTDAEFAAYEATLVKQGREEDQRRFADAQNAVKFAFGSSGYVSHVGLIAKWNRKG